MSPAATPLIRIPVGVVIERRKAESKWIDFTWRAVGVLPDEPNITPWTLLREDGETKSFYVGGGTVDLYRSETAHYRENLASGAPGVWVVMGPSDGEQPYTIATVTADPAEGEGFTEAASYLVEQVPMPESIRDAIVRFVDEHHVEREFVKRKRQRADPEALAQRPQGEREPEDRES